MNKKLFVVLLVASAMLISFSLVLASKNAPIKGVFEKMSLPTLATKQSVTPMPEGHLSEQLSASPFVSSSQSADRSIWNIFSPANPGDILWYCNAQSYSYPDTDYQIVGCETLRDTIYITGANNGLDPNYIYVWQRVSGSCQYLYKVQQPATSTGWGYRDLACDGTYLYGSYSTVLECFYVTPAGCQRVPANDVTFAALNPVRAVAYDPIHDWFWGANFSSNIYAFNRSGVQQAMYANTYPLYGLAFDTLSTPGQPWLWCNSQDYSKIYQFNPTTGVYTGVVYSGRQDYSPNAAGGLALLEGDASKGTATLLAIIQGSPDEMYAMEISTGGGPVGCCQFATYCDMLTEADCNTAGGTWNASPYTCIGTTCQLPPPDTTCHLQWDNGAASSYFGSWNVGDQQAIYYDPGTMCTDCGPDVYPFRVTQVSGVFYDFAGVGTVDVIFHLYEAGAPCDGPGAEIYSFPATITSFYPTEAIVTVPEVVCVDAPFFLAVEYNSGTTGSIPCLLMDAQVSDTCVQFNWYDGYSPPWIEWYDFWSPPPPGYLMLRADGVCNSGACAQGVPCDLIQDQGEIAYYFSGLSAGDQLAKYFDPEVYCTPPVYPYHVSDVEILLYDFAGVGSVDLRFGVNMVCHDSCDGPGTQIYLSDPITVTDFYPTMAHIDLPDVVCVYEPFFIVVQWASGAVGSTPSFLMQPETLPCDTCHAWLWYDGYSPPWWEWYDFWAPPVGGCPIVRVSGYTEDPACAQAPCDTTQETLWGGLSPYYVWRNPSRYGDRYLYERFDLPADHGGRLDQIEVAFYATGATGTPNPDFYVWLADGLYPLDNNPPYQAIGDFHINYSDIVYYPSYTTVQTWDRGIMFDPGESFMIGVGHAYAAGDTLVLLSDDGSLNSERSGEWSYGTGPWGTMLDDWGIGLDYLINAVMCPYAPPESTFTIQCSPANASATPGDPAAVKYSVSVGSVLGYNLPVTLSCTPPAGINVGFVTNPVIPPGASDVTISVDPGTSYGTYTLTFCGTGSDGQGPKCCNVSLLVQPPFDECDVPFYHGSQKGSNFGAVGNDAAPDNFLWYGLTAQLFDGTFIVTTTDDLHMALDVYNCEHVGWLPTVHANSYYDPIYNANICYGNFFTPESVISCEYDSVFFVGIMETCVDFSIKIKVYYNPTTTPIVHMYPSLFEDWDVGDAYNDRGNWDQAHNLIYQYDPVDPNLVFGMMKAPFYDDPMYNMWVVPNPYYVWPGQGFCGSGDGYLLDDLYGLISTPGYGYATWPGGPGTYPATLDTDYSILMTAQPIDLNPGDKHIEVWIDFGRNLGDGLSWAQWWHRVLRYAGFYRGDVNASDTLELPMLDVSDLVYLIDYLFQGGPAPLPYVDQGDVNADGIVDIQDVVYLLNFVFLCEPGGPKDYENCAPIDYLRFIPQKWTRPSLFLNPSWQ
jgi:hypothetical protein